MSGDHAAFGRRLQASALELEAAGRLDVAAFRAAMGAVTASQVRQAAALRLRDRSPGRRSRQLYEDAVRGQVRALADLAAVCGLEAEAAGYRAVADVVASSAAELQALLEVGLAVVDVAAEMGA